MRGSIKNFDYMSIQAQKYWSFPASYDKKKRQEQLNLMLYSNEYVASEKKDGYWEMFIKDDEGNLTMRARSQGVNGWVCKEDWVPHLHSFFDSLPNGTVVLGEVYLPGKTSRSITTILGCLVDKALDRQKKDADKLRLYIYDILAYDGKLLHDSPMIDRVKILSKLNASVNDFVSIAEYWTSPDEIHENWLRILANGGEGVVLTRKDAVYGFNKRTARVTLKLKKELQDTLDVFLTGNWKHATKEYTGTELESWPYWYDEVKEVRVYGTLAERVNNSNLVPVTRLWYNNWAGAIEVATIINGKAEVIGWLSGITDEVRKSIVEDYQKWMGKVIELQAMEIGEKDGLPTLRHAKIVRWRPDKAWTDCVWRN